MIEVNEVGVGIWMGPSALSSAVPPGEGYYSATYGPDEAFMANFNDGKTGTIELAGSNLQENELRRYINADGLGAGPARWSFGFAERKSLSKIFIKYRKRLLALGTRFRENENAAPLSGGSDEVVCLWEITLPTDEQEFAVAAQVYQDLWVLYDSVTDVESTVRPVDMRTVFGRADDPLTGEERIQEYLYISRDDGKVFSFDGVTVREEVDLGSDQLVKLGIFNGIGVLAIGRESPGTGFAGESTTSTVRFLDAPGGTWTTIAPPDVLQVTDMIGFGGAVYIACTGLRDGAIPTWTGNRIYKFDGAAFTYFEFVVGQPLRPDLYGAFSFFTHLGKLFVISTVPKNYYVTQRVSDANWTDLPNLLNFFQDFEGTVDWALPVGDAVYVGGVWTEISIGGLPTGAPDMNSKAAIMKLTNLSIVDGPTYQAVWYNTIPLEVGPTVGTEALVIMPEDIVLNDEEF